MLRGHHIVILGKSGIFFALTFSRYSSARHYRCMHQV